MRKATSVTKIKVRGSNDSDNGTNSVVWLEIRIVTG